jgi:hypothetical protein
VPKPEKLVTNQTTIQSPHHTKRWQSSVTIVANIWVACQLDYLYLDLSVQTQALPFVIVIKKSWNRNLSVKFNNI